MIEPALYLTYVLACAAVVIVPGSTVTVIIANSLRAGTLAGLCNSAIPGRLDHEGLVHCCKRHP